MLLLEPMLLMELSCQEMEQPTFRRRCYTAADEAASLLAMGLTFLPMQGSRN